MIRVWWVRRAIRCKIFRVDWQEESRVFQRATQSTDLNSFWRTWNDLKSDICLQNFSIRKINIGKKKNFIWKKNMWLLLLKRLGNQTEFSVLKELQFWITSILWEKSRDKFQWRNRTFRDWRAKTVDIHSKILIRLISEASSKPNLTTLRTWSIH